MNTLHRTLIGSSLFLSSVTAFAAFSDVNDSSFHATGINYVQSQSIVSGYEDGTYKPNQPINRAEFVKIIIASQFDAATVEGCMQNSGALFLDVPRSEWYSPYVCMAKEYGIVSGYDDGTFKPASRINVAEAAKILVETFGMQQNEGSKWFEGYVRALANVSALPTDLKSVSDELTRGQMASMIYRLHANVQNQNSLTYEELTGDASGESAQQSGAIYADFTPSVIGNGKASVLFFYAAWCPYCQSNDARLKTWFDTGSPLVSVYKVNYDTESELRARYGVVSQDTFVLIDGEGEKQDLIGFPSETALQSFVGAN